MKIVLAPNAFKGCLSAAEAAAAMQSGVLVAHPQAEIVALPVADGGDGLTDILLRGLGGRERTVLVTGPRGESVAARFIHLPAQNAAIIEMAAAAGLALLPLVRRDPCKTSTFGVGELITAALALNIKRLVIGLGGSATCDGGMGLLDALGVRFLGENQDVLEPIGENLVRIRMIDTSGLTPLLATLTVEVMCDVDNPLLGEMGAARVYAPQKGASPEAVERLEAGMTKFADCTHRALGIDVRTIPGGGAAGGVGAGLHAFLGATLRPGIEVILDLLHFSDALKDADLVLTGEGQLDAQTASGKAPAGVAAAARAQGVACVAIAGGVAADLGTLHEQGLSAAFSLCPAPVDLDTAQAQAASFIARCSEQVTRLFIAARSSS